jgi:hypothetical protein
MIPKSGDRFSEKIMLQKIGGGALYIRVRERRSRTWLAIQASTKASTSGDLRMRAHSEGESKCVRKCATMGERAMAAKSSCSLPAVTSRNDIDLLLSPAGTLWNRPDGPQRDRPPQVP